MPYMKLLSNALIGAALALSLTGGAAAQTAFAPAVIVNDDIVTYYDIDQRARLLQMNGATAGPDLNRAALEQLIDDRLRKQAGERSDIIADEEEMADARREFGTRIGIDDAALDARMAQLGVNETALADFLDSQVIWRELVNRRFGSRATPSEVELDQEIALAASSRTTSYRLSEIAVPVGQGQENQARQLMERIAREMRGGADFAALARRYSRTPSAKNGGDVGWVPETSLPPDLAALISGTPEGGVTAPFEVPGGVSIFRVADIRTESNAPVGDATVSMRRIDVPVGANGGASAAAERAEALRGETGGCDALPALGPDETVEPIEGRKVSDLPGPARDAVRALQAGQSSRPVRLDGAVAVYVMCSRSGGVSDEERAQLRDQIRNRRLIQLAEGFLQDLRREAVIER